MLKLLKEYSEGIKIFLCNCGHTVTKPKTIQEKDFKCIYCGQALC